MQKKPEKECEIGDIFEGQIVKIVDFGFFVRIKDEVQFDLSEE